MKALALLLLGITLLTLPSFAPASYAQTQPSLDVTYKVVLSQQYSLFSTLTQKGQVNVYGNVQPGNSPTLVTMTFQFTFVGISGLPPGSTKNISVVNQHPVVSQIRVFIPPSVTSFNFTVTGSFQDYSLLYRSAAAIPPIRVTSSVPPYRAQIVKLLVLKPPNTDIYSVFPNPFFGSAQNLTGIFATEQLKIGSTTYVMADYLPGLQSIVILYQPVLRDWFLFAYLALIVSLILISPFLFRILANSASVGTKTISRGVSRFLHWFSLRRLVGIFVLVSTLMIVPALVFGPSPSPKLYLASTPDTANILGPLVTSAGYSYLTPLNAGDQFNTMSDLGNFNALVLADYPVPLDSTGLAAVHRIYAMTNFLPASYVSALNATYPDTVTLIKSPEVLKSTLVNQKIYLSGNLFGLHVGETLYKIVVQLEGVLTFVLTFVAVAFLSRAIVERGGKGISAIGEVVLFSFLAFMFTTMVFVQTSVLLGLPVALHAAVSSVESATGMIGFGGGSRPRELAAVAGFVFGVLAGDGGRIKLDRVGFLVFAGLAFFLATDPLTIGRTFYGLLLSFTTSEHGSAAAAQANLGARTFLSLSMNTFGNGLSTSYYASHGAVLYYIAVVPFAVYSRLARSSASFLLLFSAFVSSIGFIRVADLNPTEALASTIPGIALGLVFLVIFLLSGLVESRLRSRFSAG